MECKWPGRSVRDRKPGNFHRERPTCDHVSVSWSACRGCTGVRGIVGDRANLTLTAYCTVRCPWPQLSRDRRSICVSAVNSRSYGAPILACVLLSEAMQLPSVQKLQTGLSDRSGCTNLGLVAHRKGGSESCVWSQPLPPRRLQLQACAWRSAHRGSRLVWLRLDRHQSELQQSADRQCAAAPHL